MSQRASHCGQIKSSAKALRRRAVTKLKLIFHMRADRASLNLFESDQKVITEGSRRNARDFVPLVHENQPRFVNPHMLVRHVAERGHNDQVPGMDQMRRSTIDTYCS